METSSAPGCLLTRRVGRVGALRHDIEENEVFEFVSFGKTPLKPGAYIFLLLQLFKFDECFLAFSRQVFVVMTYALK